MKQGVTYDARKDSWSVYLNVRGQTGRKQFKRKGFKTKGEAQQFYLEKLSETKDSLENPSKCLTFRDYFDHYIKIMSGQLMPSTIMNYETILPKHLSNAFWEKTLADITELDVREEINLVVTSDLYKKKVLSLIKTILERAFREGILNRNPANLIRIKVRESEKFALTKSEVQKLLQCARNDNHQFFYHWALALFTGMRSGELYALKWNKMDFEHDNIYVVEAWTSKNGFCGTKGKYNRVVPINSELKRLLLELKVKSTSEFVLERNNSWNHGEQAGVLRMYCKRIGIQEVSFHCLRATYITQMILDGVSLALIQKIVGHSDLEVTSIYTRVRSSELKGSSEKLSFKIPDSENEGIVIQANFQKKK